MTVRSRAPFYAFVLLLIAAGISIATWRHIELGVPWMTGEQRPVWMIEARVDFVGQDEAAQISLHIPEQPPGFSILTEQAASPGYGFSIIETSGSAPSGPSGMSPAPRHSISKPSLCLMTVPGNPRGHENRGQPPPFGKNPRLPQFAKYCARLTNAPALRKA